MRLALLRAPRRPPYSRTKLPVPGKEEHQFGSCRVPMNRGYTRITSPLEPGHCVETLIVTLPKRTVPHQSHRLNSDVLSAVPWLCKFQGGGRSFRHPGYVPRTSRCIISTLDFSGHTGVSEERRGQGSTTLLDRRYQDNSIFASRQSTLSQVS